MKFTIIKVSLKLAYDKQEIQWLLIFSGLGLICKRMFPRWWNQTSGCQQRKTEEKRFISLFVTMFFCEYQSQENGLDSSLFLLITFSLNLCVLNPFYTKDSSFDFSPLFLCSLLYYTQNFKYRQNRTGLINYF